MEAIYRQAREMGNLPGVSSSRHPASTTGVSIGLNVDVAMSARAASTEPTSSLFLRLVDLLLELVDRARLPLLSTDAPLLRSSLRCLVALQLRVECPVFSVGCRASTLAQLLVPRGGRTGGAEPLVSTDKARRVRRAQLPDSDVCSATSDGCTAARARVCRGRKAAACGSDESGSASVSAAVSDDTPRAARVRRTGWRAASESTELATDMERLLRAARVRAAAASSSAGRSVLSATEDIDCRARPRRVLRALAGAAAALCRAFSCTGCVFSAGAAGCSREDASVPAGSVTVPSRKARTIL
jgi:hypothetical protein